MFNTFGTIANTDKHFRYLGIIYKIIGWLGVAISGALFVSAFMDIYPFLSAANLELMRFAATSMLIVFIVLLISLGLLQFSRALNAKRKWATNIIGYLVGFILLFTPPIGKLLGAYTLWALVQHAKNA
ncbi:MAG: hypothetical protein C0622_12805 [Desulfuromonas sp.]|nr:MAG: hypothetical protein C0622_12805 [Desulfuromonas sp.]